MKLHWNSVLAGLGAAAVGMGLYAVSQPAFDLPSSDQRGTVDCVITLAFVPDGQEPYTISPIGRGPDEGPFQMEFGFQSKEDVARVRDRVLAVLLDETVKNPEYKK